MVDELRRAAATLLDSPLVPPTAIEDLARRNARRRARRRALAGGLTAALLLGGLTLVADGKDGGNPRVVTVPAPPDGGVFAFTTSSGAELVAAVGGSPVPVDLGGRPGRLEWSADGAWLATVVGGRLEVVDRDGSGLRDFGLDGVTGYRWSPLAPILAVQTDEGLYTVTPNGRPHRIGDAVADVEWSGDGHQLAFQDRDLDAGGIFTMDADGTRRRLVGRYADLPEAAAGLQLRGWAADGRTLLYRVHDQSLGDVPDGGQLLFALDVEDGTTFELGSVLGRNEWVQVSPDGRSVAFVSGLTLAYTNDKVLRRCDLEARTCTDLTSPERTALDPQWSPDGTRLTYVSAPDGGRLTETRLRVVDTDGRGDHEVRGAGRGVRNPSWTADGTAIVHLLTRGLDGDPPTVAVVRIDADGGEPRRAAEVEVDPATLVVAPDRVEAPVAWSPGAAASDP